MSRPEPKSVCVTDDFRTTKADAAVLRRIATDLRNLPRSCIQDREELVFWLAHRAAALDGIAERVEHPAEAP